MALLAIGYRSPSLSATAPGPAEAKILLLDPQRADAVVNTLLAAPPGTGALVQALGYPWRRIGGLQLMHQKFIVRDRVAIWTGSTNLTDDAFTSMENNVLEIASATLAQAYARDFEELWEKESFENTGDLQVPPVTLSFAGASARVQVYVSPGCGLTIDADIGSRVRAGHRPVLVCTVLMHTRGSAG